MADFWFLVWAVIPPLLLLYYYYYRVFTAPPLLKLLLLFICGAISGFVALGLEVVFETVANWVVNWRQMNYSLPGIALRQLVEIGPIEEGCKLVMVIAATYYLQRRYRLRLSTVFIFTIAVALGFSAQENWVYLFYNTASIPDRIIGTPVHAMFSAPWGYALGMNLNHNRNLLFRAWLNSVVCHALVNVLSSAGRYPLPLRFLNYALFPFLLWMFWRMEQLLRRSQGKPPITLISGNTPQLRYWKKGLVLFALVLGGNAIFGLFILARNLSPLSWSQLFYPHILWFILSRLFINIIFAIIAWLIYLYLRRSAQRRYF
ncbi:MAG: PrsW family glutamic-type intramembrane protease [Aulosira sp. DedQUE10]|nr:PrsW family glutamic-type intramembrane protease [Aulosira sp. DedQUE10]